MSVRDRVARHRKKLREQGLRPIQVWVPDVNQPGFAEEVKRQIARAEAADHEDGTMEWLDAARADWWDDDE